MKDEAGDRREAVRDFLKRHRWLTAIDDISFIAAGEYNENYRVDAGGESFVFRINHGTQLGLENQSGYEFTVLKAVEPSGRTPRPIRHCPADRQFPRGAILMEYIPGRALDYRQDWEEAAELFAVIHALPPARGLIRQEHPVADIVAESRELLGRYPDHPLRDVGRRITAFAERIAALGRRDDPRMQTDRLCIVNTEVNSGNFIKGPRGLFLVDWEKAVVSYRYQDLGHFLVSTTTLWKSDFVFDPPAREAFLRRYHSVAESPVPFDDLHELTATLERTIVLRALAWCYMAYAEYTRTSRTLQNRDAFATIESYLKRADALMEQAGES